MIEKHLAQLLKTKKLLQGYEEKLGAEKAFKSLKRFHNERYSCGSFEAYLVLFFGDV